MIIVENAAIDETFETIIPPRSNNPYFDESSYLIV